MGGRVCTMEIDFFLRLESEPGELNGFWVLLKTIKVLRTEDWTILTIDAYGVGDGYERVVRAKNGIWISRKGLVPVPDINTLGRLIREIMEAKETLSSGE